MSSSDSARVGESLLALVPLLTDKGPSLVEAWPREELESASRPGGVVLRRLKHCWFLGSWGHRRLENNEEALTGSDQ